MKLKYFKNIATLSLNQEKCIGCGMCIEVCPHNVFKMIEKKAVIDDKDACMECGACSKNCPADAISVKVGVGCAAAIYKGILTNSEPTCGCSDNNSSCCG